MKRSESAASDLGHAMLFAPPILSADQAAGAPVPQGRTALERLFEAYQCAKELKRTVWDFAVEIEELQRIGCTNSEFRWLVCRGFAAHGLEIPSKDRMHRAFEQHGGLAFGERTCFTLTEAGVPIARSLASRSLAARRAHNGHPIPLGSDHRENGTPGGLVPQWDHDLAELRLGDQLIKRFRVPALNQEKILAAFEEEQWPVRIDDPLPPRSDQLPKRRLHDTINSLNRNQKRPLIRFLGDGRGEGVRWHLVRPNGSDLKGHATGR